MKRIFSGIQPSGTLHVGNYGGAIKNWITLQDEYECIFSIVDYHSITQSYDIKNFYSTVRNMLIDLISCGLSPEKSKIFIQSDIPEHTELSWILSSVTSMGDLERMTQFKEKSKRANEYINAGLFTYPILQASDIILYKAERVPIGEDQVQHLEIAREIVRRFNRTYADVFPEPQALLTKTPRIMGIDGKNKMSKSLDNHIPFNADDEDIRKRIMSCLTDENRQRKSDPGNPDICNVFTIHKLFTPEETVNEINSECRKAGIGCVDCKKKLHSNMMDGFLKGFKEKREKLINNPDELDNILEKGKQECSLIAKQTMKETKTALGIIRK